METLVLREDDLRSPGEGGTAGSVLHCMGSAITGPCTWAAQVSVRVHAQGKCALSSMCGEHLAGTSCSCTNAYAWPPVLRTPSSRGWIQLVTCAATQKQCTSAVHIYAMLLHPTSARQGQVIHTLRVHPRHGPPPLPVPYHGVCHVAAAEP
jgi:hypothetical protein